MGDDRHCRDLTWCCTLLLYLALWWVQDEYMGRIGHLAYTLTKGVILSGDRLDLIYYPLLRLSPPGLAILPLMAKESSSVPFVKNHTPPGLAICPLTPNGPLSTNCSAKIASNSGAISG
eukprot:scaffold6057_cov66-Attheya_sp.AAC.2